MFTPEWIAVFGPVQLHAFDASGIASLGNLRALGTLELPCLEIALRLRSRVGEEPRQRPPPRDLFLCKLVEQRRSNSFLGDRVDDIGRDDDAIAVANDDVAGIDGDATAADGQIEIDRLVHNRARRRARPPQVAGKACFQNALRFPEAAVGDDAGAAARFQPADIEIAGGRSPWIATRVDNEDISRWAFLHRLHLCPAAIGCVWTGLILARRDKAHGEREPNHARLGYAKRIDVLHEHVAQPAPVEDSGECRRINFEQTPSRCLKQWHWFLPSQQCVQPGSLARPGRSWPASRECARRLARAHSESQSSRQASHPPCRPRPHPWRPTDWSRSARVCFGSRCCTSYPRGAPRSPGSLQ